MWNCGEYFNSISGLFDFYLQSVSVFARLLPINTSPMSFWMFRICHEPILSHFTLIHSQKLSIHSHFSAVTSTHNKIGFTPIYAHTHTDSFIFMIHKNVKNTIYIISFSSFHSKFTPIYLLLYFINFLVFQLCAQCVRFSINFWFTLTLDRKKMGNRFRVLLSFFHT